jgi:hypothetical protein
MLGRSFHPSQWFEEGERPDPEDNLMWVYRQTSDGTFVVGFYDPERKWHEESSHRDRGSAATRVHWLNGGKLPAEGVREAAERGFHSKG